MIPLTPVLVAASLALAGGAVAGDSAAHCEELLAMARERLAEEDARTAHEVATRALACARGAELPVPELVEFVDFAATVSLIRLEDDSGRELLMEALRLREDYYGSESAEAAESYDDLGNHVFRSGAYDDSRRWFELGRSARIADLGPTHPDVAISEILIGYLESTLENHAEAESHMRRALEIRREALGADDDLTLEAAVHLAAVLDAAGKRGEAQAVRREYLSDDGST